MVVITDKTRDTRFTAQEGQVVCYVGSTTECLFRIEYMGNWHWCLRRDTRNLSVVILIQHDIADHENLALFGLAGNKIV